MTVSIGIRVPAKTGLDPSLPRRRSITPASCTSRWASLLPSVSGAKQTGAHRSVVDDHPQGGAQLTLTAAAIEDHANPLVSRELLLEVAVEVGVVAAHDQDLPEVGELDLRPLEFAVHAHLPEGRRGAGQATFRVHPIAGESEHAAETQVAVSDERAHTALAGQPTGFAIG